MSLIEALSILLYLLIVSGCAYHLFSLFCVWDFFSASGSNGFPPEPSPVSVLKPLKGLDPELRENLRSFCKQEYPEYEVLLGFSKPSDSEVKRLTESILPFIDTCNVRVVASSLDLGANKKVSNLQGLVQAAKYPLLAISDSDMRADSRYLREITAEYYSGQNVGMVTSLYKISNPGSLGTAFESLTIALDYMPSVLVARRLEGVTFGLGASMLVSKKALDDIGGLPPIADYLADDYQMGNRLWRKGYKVILSHVVLENVVGRMKMRDYIAHQVRWARTYRSSRPKGFAGYGIAHILLFSLLLLLLQGPGPFALSAVGGVLLIRSVSAAVIYRKVIRSGKWLKWLPIFPIKDVISFGIWASSFLGNTVVWRGRTYKILKGGKIREMA